MIGKLLKYGGLLFLLAFAFMAAEGISGVATGKAAAASSLSVPASKAKHAISFPQRHSLPVAELGGVYGHAFHKDLSSNNVLRTSNPGTDIDALLRAYGKAVLLCEELMAKEKGKQHPASFSSIAYPTCEYYVFALRSIVI